MPTLRRFEVEGPYTTAERDGLAGMLTGMLIFNSTTVIIERWTGSIWQPLSPVLGTVLLDFGAFPGKSDASVAVTGQAGIVAGSKVMAWLRPSATSDHTADEHMVETIKVFAGNIVAGTGFTIYGFNDNQVNESLLPGGEGPAATAVIGAQSNDSSPRIGGIGALLWGLWNVAWLWQ